MFVVEMFSKFGVCVVLNLDGIIVIEGDKLVLIEEIYFVFDGLELWEDWELFFIKLELDYCEV